MPPISVPLRATRAERAPRERETISTDDDRPAEDDGEFFELFEGVAGQQLQALGRNGGEARTDAT